MAYERGEDSPGLFRSSLAADPDSELVPQSQLLDPSTYEEKTVPTFDETDYQSEFGVSECGGGVVGLIRHPIFNASEYL
jgi:hypothetical protein